MAETMAETSGVKMAEDVRAEIVASVLEVVVNEGDQIGKGDIVVLLESMKMEIPVLAEVGGTVSKVSCVGGRCHSGRRPDRRDQLAAGSSHRRRERLEITMSTLGDLLAEHTMLPGNAVDHLHAVVGEWQLLADLSFADYLMWVRRDDGVLVCVAQCRPNTAPTVLQTDAVGSVVAADRLPLVAESFRVRSPPCRKLLWENKIRGNYPAQNVGASPVRYRDQVVAVLTQHQTELAAERSSGHLETAYRECADRSSAHDRRGQFPRRGRRRHVALHPAGRATASSGWMSTARSPTPAPTRCRPTTGWA